MSWWLVIFSIPGCTCCSPALLTKMSMEGKAWPAWRMTSLQKASSPTSPAISRHFAPLFYILLRLFGILMLIKVNDDHICAFLREQNGYGAPDSAVPARDNRSFPSSFSPLSACQTQGADPSHIQSPAAGFDAAAARFSSSD